MPSPAALAYAVRFRAEPTVPPAPLAGFGPTGPTTPRAGGAGRDASGIEQTRALSDDGPTSPTTKQVERECSAVAPGVPPAWLDGLARLRTMPAPPGVSAVRWAGFLADAERLLAEHGAELHRLGWGGLDVFGLHRWAPFARYDAAGLAWLTHGRPLTALSADMAVLALSGGGSLRATRMGGAARREAVAAWALAPEAVRELRT